LKLSVVKPLPPQAGLPETHIHWKTVAGVALDPKGRRERPFVSRSLESLAQQKATGGGNACPDEGLRW
jgi:hypothetical protein